MGLAKSRFIEEQEQGWTFFRNKFACPACFQDKDIRVFIQEIATEKECSYCDSLATDEPIAADMNEIMELIMDGIRLEWGDPNDEGMPWDSGEGGWLGSVFDTDEILEKIGFRTMDEKVYSDICGAIRNNQWCQRHVFHLLPPQELISDWKLFSDVVMYKTRFVFYKMEGDSNRLYVGQEPVPSHLILDTLGKLTREMGLVTGIPSGTEFFRARVHTENEECSTIGKLGPPPVSRARFSNRMSPAGIPMFYGSADKLTAVKEVSYDVRLPAVATVGTFVTLKEIKVLDLTKVHPEPGLFDRAKHGIRPACIFLNAFVDDLTKPVKKDGREHVEYVPSQVVTEYFRHIFRDNDKLPIHGILFPSAVKEGGTSCVFFFGPARDQAFFVDKNAIDQWMQLKQPVDRKILQLDDRLF